MNLQLSLKKQWFEMTKKGIKIEDYREITPYYCNRLLLQNDNVMSQYWWKLYILDFKDTLAHVYQMKCQTHRIKQRFFTNNIMTLGYPKILESGRILNFEHKGIEIRSGNPDWGAEPDKLYFVILHGSVLK